MLGNTSSLVALANDPSYEAKLSGPLQLLQELRWRAGYGVLKANSLFVFDHQPKALRPGSPSDEPPFLILFIEDCYVQLGDDNSIGKEFSFEIKYKTTGSSYIFSAADFKSLERWVTQLTVTPMEYISITKQSFLEQIEVLDEEKAKRERRTPDNGRDHS